MHPQVAAAIAGAESVVLADLGRELGITLEVRSETRLKVDGYEIGVT